MYGGLENSKHCSLKEKITSFCEAVQSVLMVNLVDWRNKLLHVIFNKESLASSSSVTLYLEGLNAISAW